MCIELGEAARPVDWKNNPAVWQLLLLWLFLLAEGFQSSASLPVCSTYSSMPGNVLAILFAKKFTSLPAVVPC
jgi:hypothetical protein